MKIVNLLVLVLLVLSVSNESSAASRNIYILKSQGICEGCAEAVSRMLISAGIRSQIIGPEHVTTLVIYRGGRYIGICAGAYLTEKWIDRSSGERGLDIFPGEIDNYSKDKSAKLMLTQWQGRTRWVYFQDGPSMVPKSTSAVKIFGTFSDTKKPAALSFQYGKGTVGLISPHPEASQQWFDVANLVPRDGISYDLGIQVFKEILK